MNDVPWFTVKCEVKIDLYRDLSNFLLEKTKKYAIFRKKQNRSVPILIGLGIAPYKSLSRQFVR